MKQEETSCPKMLKVLYFPLILCYIRALFLPYRTQLKIGISNAKATHIQPTFKDLLLHKGCKASENAGKNNLSDCAKKNISTEHVTTAIFSYRDKGTQDVAYQDKGAQFFCQHPTVKEGKKKGQMDTSM